MDESNPFDATQTIFPITFSQATIPLLGLEKVGEQALNIFESPSEEDLKELPHPDMQVNDITLTYWHEVWVNTPLNELFYKTLESSEWIADKSGQMAIAKTDYIKLDKNSQYYLNCSPNTELVGILVVADNPQQNEEDQPSYTSISLEIEDPALDKKRLTSQTANHKIFSGEELVYKTTVEARTVFLMPSFLRCRFLNNTDSNFKIFKSDLCFKNRPLNSYVESHLQETDYQERLENDVNIILDTHLGSLLTSSDVANLSESEKKAKAREVASMPLEDKYNYYKTEYEKVQEELQPVAKPEELQPEIKIDPADQIDLDATDIEKE